MTETDAETLRQLTRGDEIAVTVDGRERRLVVDATVLTPPEPPADVADELGIEQLPSDYTVIAEHEPSGTPYNLVAGLEDGEAVPPVTASAKLVIDIRVPVRRRWEDLGEVEQLRLEAAAAPDVDGDRHG